MTQTTSRWKSGSAFLNPRLRKLLEEGGLDWDDPRHREAYLKYWLCRPCRRKRNHPLSDLLVIVPSRGRPNNIARLLDAVHATAKAQTHVHVAVDDDDPELERYRYVMGQAAGEGDKLTVGPRKGLTGWTNEIAVPAAEEYPYLASLGDDMVPRTPGWDEALIRGIERMGGTGFTYPWDGVREDIPEAVVLSSGIVRALGWMAHP